MSGVGPGSLSPGTVSAVGKEVAIHRSLLGVDSGAWISRAALAELAAAYETLKLHLDAERIRAEKAERREAQFRGWWADVSKQLRDLQQKRIAE